MSNSPGQLRYRVAIERETLVDDGMGGHTVTLATVATIWAEVTPASGSERKAFDKLNAEALYSFIIRRRSDLLETDRLIFEGVRYNIHAIHNWGPKPLYLKIMAERGVAQ